MNEPKLCPNAAKCPMYGSFKMKAVLDFWSGNYCRSDYEACERYRRKACGEPVSPTLLPNGKDMEAPSR